MSTPICKRCAQPTAPPLANAQAAPRSVCLIVNPAAGGGRAGRAAPGVVDALRGHGLTVRREDTRDLDHARELALGAARGGELAVTLGGDGLAGAAADALRAVPGSILGVLPGGRGNDLARVLGIGQNPVAACAVIAGGVARELDLGLVGEHTFVGIASCGFDSDANRIANEAPSWLGNLVYAYGALRALAAWRPARFELVLDGRRHTLHRLQRRRRQLEGLRRRHVRGARRAARRRPARRPLLRADPQAALPHADPAEGLQGHARA